MASADVCGKAEPVELMLGSMYPSISDTQCVASNRMHVLPLPTTLTAPSPAGSVGHGRGQQSPVRSPYHVQPYAEQQQSPVRSPCHVQPYAEQQQSPVRSPHPLQLYVGQQSPARGLFNFQPYLEHQEQPSLVELEPNHRYDREHQYQQRSHCQNEHCHKHHGQHQHQQHHRPSSHRHPQRHSHSHQYLQQGGDDSYTIPPTTYTSSGPYTPDGYGHTPAAYLAHDPPFPRLYGSSSLTRAPPDMVVARTAHGWEPWVYALTAKQRNLLVKELNLSPQEASSLKTECRKRRQRKAQSEYKARKRAAERDRQLADST